MSIILAVISSVAPTVQAVATATPHVVAQATPVAVAHVSSISDTINALASKVSTADLLVAGGFVATGVQYLVNRFVGLRKAANWLISFAVPFAGVALASFASGHNDLHLAPVVYLLGQAAYFAIEQVKSSVKVTSDVAPAQL